MGLDGLDGWVFGCLRCFGCLGLGPERKRECSEMLIDSSRIFGWWTVAARPLEFLFCGGGGLIGYELGAWVQSWSHLPAGEHAEIWILGWQAEC